MPGGSPLFNMSKSQRGEMDREKGIKITLRNGGFMTEADLEKERVKQEKETE